MHEWYITEELLDKICAQAKENRINKIAKIQVELGKDGHIGEESLRFHFQQQSEGTVAEGASLEIESVPGDSLFLVYLEGE